jgi:hypothetical protein
MGRCRAVRLSHYREQAPFSKAVENDEHRERAGISIALEPGPIAAYGWKGLVRQNSESSFSAFSGEHVRSCKNATSPTVDDFLQLTLKLGEPVLVWAAQRSLL